MFRKRPPGARVVLWFALTSLVVFVLVGVAIVVARSGEVREREEGVAGVHAELVARQVIAPLLTARDLEAPIIGERYQSLSARIHDLVMTDASIERVKVWNQDGVVVFSDDPEQVGDRPGIEDDLAGALEGELENEVSDLEGAENVEERGIADRLFETYVPLRLRMGGPVVGAIEVYQDYSPIEAEVDRLTSTLAVSLTLGLFGLWAILMPAMVGLTRTLRRQNDQLQELAGSLSELLEREQETVAELRELDRMKSDFVSAASHELRTPLTTIRGYAQLLQQEPAASMPGMREGLDAIVRQSARLYRVVRNLLREAHLEPDDPDHADMFRPIDLVQDVRNDFPEAADRLELSASDELISADRASMVEILANLIDNALKFGPTDRTVEVRAEVERGSLRMWVRDQGQGIAPETIPHLFDRFRQGDQSATRQHGGLGLGLHLVRGLAEGSGGNVWVESTRGEGTTFTVQVPVRVMQGATTPAVT
jgi:signal transduction histidine kinase